MFEVNKARSPGEAISLAFVHVDALNKSKRFKVIFQIALVNILFYTGEGNTVYGAIPKGIGRVEVDGTILMELNIRLSRSINFDGSTEMYLSNGCLGAYTLSMDPSTSCTCNCLTRSADTLCQN